MQRPNAERRRQQAIIDGIPTRYDVIGSGPPLLMMSPGGFDATIEKWRTQGVYTRLKLLDHLPRHYTCIVYDRRESGESGGRVEHITWAHYVAQAKGLLDHLQIRSCARHGRVHGLLAGDGVWCCASGGDDAAWCCTGPSAARTTASTATRALPSTSPT